MLDNPLVITDDGETTSETGTSTRVSTVESEIGTAQLPSSHPREQPKTHGCLNPHTATESTTFSLDCPTSPSVTLPQDRGGQTASGDDLGAAATVDPLSLTAITPLSPEQPQDQGGSALDEEEWEIVRIVGQRRTRKGYEYKVR